MAPTSSLLVVTHYFPNHRGGVEIVAGHLIQALTNHFPWRVQWVASDTETPPADTPSLTGWSVKTANHIEDWLHFAYPLWGPQGYGLIERQIRQAQVIHLHEYIYVGNIWAFWLARRQRKPVVITQHIGFIPYKNPVLRGILTLVNRTLGKWMLTKADQVVFCSQVIQDYWQSQPLNFRHPPRLIPNGVDTDMFLPLSPGDRQTLREEFNIKPQDLVILFVGRFIEKKGLALLEKMAAHYPDVTWWFAGWGPLNPEQWQRPNVKVFGDRQGDQLTPLYQAADLLILPSAGEAFPLVIQEAMACGTPAIVSEESAHQYPDLASILFAAPVDPVPRWEDWHAVLHPLIENPSPLADLRPQVATTARQLWSWTETARQYDQIFQSLAKKSCPPRD